MASYWFFVLGLDFDTVPSVEEVKAAITSKSNYWNDDLQAIGKYASYYTSLAERVPQMKHDLSDVDGIAIHAKNASDIAWPIIDRLLNGAASATAGGKAIEKGKLAGLCNLARREIARQSSLPFVEVSDELVSRRANALGIVFDADNDIGSAVDLYKRIAAGEPTGLREFRSAENDLIPLGKRNLYEFAQPDGIDDPRRLESGALLAQAHALLHELRMSPALRSAAEKLIPSMNSIIGDAEKRAQYDRYLCWKEVNEALDSAGQIAELGGGVLGGWNAADAHKRIASAVGDSRDAELIIIGYCHSREPKLIYGGLPETRTHDKRPSTITLDVESLSLKVGEVQRITITASGEHLTCTTSDKTIIETEWEEVAGAWTLLVKGLGVGRASLDIGVVEDDEQLGCYAPTVDVVVAEIARRDVKIAADKRCLNLTVGEKGYIHFTSNSNEAFSASVGGILKDCVTWHEDGSNTLVVAPEKPGEAKIGVRTKQDEEYNESNWVEIAVSVRARDMSKPNLAFSSPNILMQNGVQSVYLRKGETIPVQVVTDTDATISAKWDNGGLFTTQWSNQPIPNVLNITGTNEGWTSLWIEAPQTASYYGISRSDLSLRVVVQQGQTPPSSLDPTPQPQPQPKEGNLWQRSGCIVKGLIVYAIWCIVMIVGWGILSAIGMVAGG